MALPLLTSNSPVKIGGLSVTNPLAINNQYAGGNSPVPAPTTTQNTTQNSTPAPTPTGTQTNTSGTGGTAGGATGGSTTPALTAAQLQAQQDFINGQNNATNLINQGISGAAGGYSGSILDYLSSLKQQQNTINSEHVQNQLARMQGVAGVNQMVSHGIQSGGVTLGNDNAANSSAADALARAYSVLGREQLSGVGNQFAQAEVKPATDQTNLDQANTDEVRHAQLDKTNSINTIVNDASQKLTALNQMAMYASIPDRVNIDQQIQQVRQQAMDALTAYDQSLTSGIAANAPTSADQNLASAAGLRTAGTAPENSFQFTTAEPTQFQNTGPVPSELPIFTTPKKQTT